ncbi:MAG: hypothetical protein H6907_00600 [Hyphomicrobiales bacterium]|nr:hypothetical protein [Hyphomicrobiales bacterium]MCP5370210.1 hypothetical protein [Hyphomicrobiales bacterium]
MEDGAITSVRAAAIEAGMIRERTPLMDLRRAWGHASEDTRAAFMAEVGAEFGIGATAPPPAADDGLSVQDLVHAVAEALAGAEGDAGAGADAARNYAAPVQRHLQRFLVDMTAWSQELADALPAAERARVDGLLARVRVLAREE